MSTLNPVRNTGCCEGLYNQAAVGANKLGGYAKTAYASAGETLTRVWSAVSAFFSNIAQKIAVFCRAAAGVISAGFVKAKDAIVNLPKEGKIAIGAGVGLAALLTAIFCRCCSKKEEKTTTETKTEEVVAAKTDGNKEVQEQKVTTEQTVKKE